jgi:hypothetical protein
MHAAKKLYLQRREGRRKSHFLRGCQPIRHPANSHPRRSQPYMPPWLCSTNQDDEPRPQDSEVADREDGEPIRPQLAPTQGKNENRR